MLTQTQLQIGWRPHSKRQRSAIRLRWNTRRNRFCEQSTGHKSATSVPNDDGFVDPSITGDYGRCVAERRAGGTNARRPQSHTRLAATDRMRQRAGVYQQSVGAVGAEKRRWVAIYSARQNQNAYCEAFNARLRDECLNLHWFSNVPAAQQQIEQWRQEFNMERPHSSLGYRTPNQFAQAYDNRLAA